MATTRDVHLRLLRYVRPHLGTVLLGVLASSFGAAAAAGYAYLVGPLLKAVVMGGQVELAGFTIEPAGLLTTLPLWVLGVALVKAGAQWLQAGLMQGVGQRILATLRCELYGHLLEQPPSFYERRHSGELLARLSADVAQVEFAVSQALTSYVKDSLQLLALLGVCWVIDPRLFMIAFLVVPGAIVPVTRFARSVKATARRSQASLGALSTLASEQLQNLPVVVAYDTRELALRRFDEEQGRYLAAMRRSLLLRGAVTPTVEFLGIVGAAVAISFGARAIAVEPELASKLLSFLAASLLMYQPLKGLSITFAQVKQGLAAGERLFELVDAPFEASGQGQVGPLRRELRFEELVVSYDGSRRVLDGFCATLPAGSTVALVGASGAGKSTLVSTLLGFLRPSGGRVLWDGEELSSVCPASARLQMAWVPQEPVLFTGSVRENLLLARPDASEEALWLALRRAHSEGFVRALPSGLEEPVGERGGRLSGGQRQRLAIARAFLREPSLLLLDEPTSALDAASEHEVQAGLAELSSGRTTLVIAHRLATVRDADQIWVLEGGRVVERGSHEELSSAGGRYGRLLAAGGLAA